MITDLQVHAGKTYTVFPPFLRATIIIWLKILLVLLMVLVAGSAVLTAQAPAIEATDQGHSFEAWADRYQAQAQWIAANEAARQRSLLAQSARYQGAADLFANEGSRLRGLEAWSARYQGQADLVAAQTAPQQRGFGGGGGQPAKKD